MPKSFIILIWILTVPIGSAVIFGIVQPIVWRILYSTNPPNLVLDLSVLLTLFLASLALGTTAFGVGVYQFVGRRIQDNAQEDADIRLTRGLAFQLAQLALGRWLDYENTTAQLNTEESTVTRLKEWAAVHLDEAIRLSVQAFETYASLLDDTNTENEHLICEIRNNWAYFLAVRQTKEDKATAEACVDYLEARKTRYPSSAPQWDDTIRFIRSRFP